MRGALLVVLVLLVPTALAETTLHVHHTQHAGTAAGLAYVHDGGTVLTHQNMELRIANGERTWFVTDNMHEHDGITTFHTGLHDQAAVTVKGDRTVAGEPGVRTDPAPATMTVTADAATVRVETDAALVGEWVARDQDGVLARGWFDQESGTTDLVTINVAGDHAVEVRSVAGDLETVSLGPLTAENTLRPIPPEEEVVPCGMDVRIDPAEVLTGNPVRVTVGDLSEKATVHYRLMQDVDALNQYTALQWSSTAAAGAAAFRVPAAGIYNLRVDSEDGAACNLVINAEEGSSEAKQPDWDFVQDGPDVVFTASMGGRGHYEFPLWVSHEHDGHHTLIWAGKMHSHGGAVDFVIPDALPGDYTVRFDVGAQDADPTAPSATGWTDTITVDAVEEGPKEAAAPWGVLAVLAVGLLLRRR